MGPLGASLHGHDDGSGEVEKALRYAFLSGLRELKKKFEFDRIWSG